ncbi:GNAT family protein [Pontibacterium granulatum]|uniref:GNAT family N-acetyltransferase n=1 Tax=Pontibacterium granulatum TaxID=2036029 RepID=UPI00249BE014|nr:GNAT family protein [Pontibacterium granulatum]MDI3326738.1 GNAT family protein [Pontibacterium granulatum]
MRQNEFGQPIGTAVDNWTPRPFPSPKPMQGQYCWLEGLSPSKHGDQLFDAFGKDPEGKNWTYLFDGPFDTRSDFDAWIDHVSKTSDPLFYAIIDPKTERAVGVASYMRIDPANGVLEVGNIHFSPLLQKTPLATEAMYLMMRRAFDELGYRRYEWKCDSLNALSRNAATRFGFTFEGIFRQAIMYKGRSRDTAWFSIIDSEWPATQSMFESWLDASNFDADGQQKTKLQECAPEGAE